MLKDGPEEGVESEVPRGVRARMECGMNHSRARERKRDRSAERGGYLSRCHHEGLGLPVDNRPRAELKGATVFDGAHVAGGDPSNVPPLGSEGVSEP
jgi:hypothetical protein